MSPDKAMIGYLQARIAELEAELDDANHAWLNEQVAKNEGIARAEKAEAEVERLSKLLDWWETEHGVPGNYPDVGVNPSGLSLSAGKPRESDGGKGS